jgi:hypothetical protein
MIFTLRDFLLKEAKQQKTAQKTDWESIFQNLRQQGLAPDPNLPTAAPSPASDQRTPRPSASAPHTRASKATTQQRVQNIPPSADAARMMANADLSGEDDISDAQARINAGADAHERPIPTRAPTPTPAPQPAALRSPYPATLTTKTQNLPAVLSTELARMSDVEPQWHAVKHLPGYLQSGIRAMGRSVFRAFTDVPIEEIQVLANMQNAGQPNTQEELDAVVVFLQQHGQRSNELEIQFQEKIPGYNIQLRAFKALGYTFLTGSDAYGKYVYSWASGDNDLSQLQVDTTDRPQLGVDRPRLR